MIQGQYRCNKCDVMLNSEAQLMQHLGSLRHQSGGATNSGTNGSVKSHPSTSSTTDLSPNQSSPNDLSPNENSSPNRHHHKTQREFYPENSPLNKEN